MFMRRAAYRRERGARRQRTYHLTRRLILAQSLINDLPQQSVVGPGEESHFGHKFGPQPVDARQDERRAKAAGAVRGQSSGIRGAASDSSRWGTRASSVLVMPVPARPA